jgi:hypothetical protein
MSSAEDSSPDREPERPPVTSTEAGRTRGRVLIPGVLLSAIVIVFVFVLLVSKCGGESGEINGLGTDAGVSTAAVGPSAV